MDILFINSTDGLALRREINGTMLLATILRRAGFDTGILRFSQIDSYGKDYDAFIADITRRTLALEPRCVSFYNLWPYYHIMLRIARELKQARPEIVTVFAGPQAALTAEATLSAMPFVDYVCTGEGENTVVPFFSGILAGTDISRVPGLYLREAGIPVCHCPRVPLVELDTLPRWDPALYREAYQESPAALSSGSYYLPIDVGRGCPFGCTFCCASGLWNRTYRLKSAERIVDEIRYYYETFGIRSFSFSHDAFTVNRNLVLRVCDALIQSGMTITWKCTTRVNCIDEELILRMKEAGMRAIELGVETGSKRMQTIINKKLDLDRLEGIVRFLLKQRIQVSLFFMYGFPEETEADLNDTLTLLFSMVDLGVSYTSMSFCVFNPGSKMTREYFDRLEFDDDCRIHARGVFGYDRELDVIRANKALFPFFFSLHTPLRDRYQYLSALVYVYRLLPDSMRRVRELYGGDHLRLFRDFFDSNRLLIENHIYDLVPVLKENAAEMICNTICRLDEPYIPQLAGLVRYEWDLYRVRQSKADLSVRAVYPFSYVELKLKVPTEKFSAGETELLIQKKDGKLSMKVLAIR